MIKVVSFFIYMKCLGEIYSNRLVSVSTLLPKVMPC